MEQSLAKKLKNNSIEKNSLWLYKEFCVLLLWSFFSFAQFNSSLPLINPPEDCPIAMRICDATKEYSFQLSSWGAIDDAHGSMNIPGLAQSSATRFESRVAWLKFTPQYSGQFGMHVCPETLEDIQYEIFTNPNCSNIEQGLYNLANTNMLISGQMCTGYGLDNPNANGSNFLPYVNLTAGNTYILLILTRSINQTGTHRFTLKFTGQLVQDHPDVFNHPECLMATQDFNLQNVVNIYPNPFTNTLHIQSDTNFKTMALYDVLGKEIINQSFVNELNTGNLAQGVYFLQLVDDEENKVVKKVVKE